MDSYMDPRLMGYDAWAMNLDMTKVSWS